MTNPNATRELTEALVASCLERIPLEGPAVIDEVCREHPQLLPEVRRLLRILEGLGLDAQEDPDATRGLPRATLPRGFGRFRLLELLGSGGMGTVYLAEDREMNRRVALKLMRGELQDSPQARSRFRREVKVLARLDHPNLCTVFDAGEHEGQLWLAMRLVPGETLRQTIEREKEARASNTATKSARASFDALDTRVRLDRWLTVFEQAARALHHAHEAGLVHRDIKPGNLMLTPEDDIVVLDFGIAHASSDRLTATSDRLGTVAYMAPEQIDPQRDSVDRRADVYALAVSLFEMLTLELPYEAPTAAGLEREIRDGTRRRARRLAPRLPPELDWVLDRALDIEPGRRYASALDLANDLRRVRMREPIAARRPSRLLRARRWVQRNPFPAALTLVLAAGLLSSLVLLARGNRALARSDAVGMSLLSSSLSYAEPVRALELALRAAQLEPGADTYSQLDQALLRVPLVTRVEPWIEAGEPASFSIRPAPHHGAILVLAVRGGTFENASLLRGSERRTIDPAGGVYDASWSPDGSCFVTTSGSDHVDIWTADGEHAETIQTPGPVARARLFPDNARVLMSGADGVGRLWHRSEKTWATIGRVPGPCRGLDLAADGTIAVLVGRNHRFLIHEFASGKSRRGLPPDGPTRLPNGGRDEGNINRVQLSQDGRFFLATTEMARITRLFGTSGELVEAFGGLGDPVLARLSPDGRWLLTAHVDQRARLWTLAGDRPQLARELVGHTGVVWDGCFSPDSGVVATRGTDVSVRVFDVPTGREVAVLRNPAEEIQDVVFTADAREVVTIDHDGRLSRYRWLDPEAPVLGGTRTGVHWILELGDGWPGTIATGDAHREITFWNADGRRVARHEIEQARMGEAALSPSGRWLAIAGRRFVQIFAPPFRRVASFPVGSTWAKLRFGPGDLLLVLHRTRETASRLAALRPEASGTWRLLAEDELARLVPGDAARIYDLAWDGGSGRAVIGCRDGRVELCSHGNERLRVERTIATGWGIVRRVALSESHGHFAACSAAGNVVLFDRDGERLATHPAEAGSTADIDIAADGSQFLAVSPSTGVRIVDATGELLLRLKPQQGLALYARFSNRPGSVWIGSSAQSARLAITDRARLRQRALARIEAAKGSAARPATR